MKPAPQPTAQPTGPSSTTPFAPGDDAELRGVAAAPGRAAGVAVRVTRVRITVAEPGEGVEVERARLEAALTATRVAISAEAAACGAKGGAGQEILAAHLTFLEDPTLTDAAAAAMTAGKSAGFAWRSAIDAQVDMLRGLGIGRMAERIDDLLDVEHRVLAALTGAQAAGPDLPEGAILIGEDVLPSALTGANAGRVAGLAIGGGGPTSHVAILAASLGIPAVVALGVELARVPDGAPLILDGDKGVLRVHPPEGDIAALREGAAQRAATALALRAAAQAECRMADGTRIEVMANIGAPGDAERAMENGAEGSGLVRTEFLFLDRDTAPTEDEQLAQYQAIATAFGGRPVIVRTLDAGADKVLPYLAQPKEENPALGVRGLRVGLRKPELLRAQLRAILRVMPHGQCRIMLPMVASLDELRRTRAMLEEERARLGVAPVQLGIMIEVPSAAVMADLLAPEADFFSVGTNDLTQYALAMDRMNPELAPEVDAFHPAVLRMIEMTARAATPHGRMVGVCGGLASSLLAAPLLAGLGVTELSATVASVPAVKARLRGVTLAECKELAQAALGLASAQAVRALIAARMPDV